MPLHPEGPEPKPGYARHPHARFRHGLVLCSPWQSPFYLNTHRLKKRPNQIRSLDSPSQSLRRGFLKGYAHVGIVGIAFSITLKHENPDYVLGRVGPTPRAEGSAV